MVNIYLCIIKQTCNKHYFTFTYSANDENDLVVEEELADTDEALPTLSQVSSFINLIRTFVEMRCYVTINILNSLNDLEGFVKNEKWKSVIQTKRTDYF